jgi:hypothetical protein
MGAILSASCQTSSQTSNQQTAKHEIKERLDDAANPKTPSVSLKMGNGVYEFSLYTKRVLAGLVGS